jgi:tetratricopeptide (TPR) repeat protein
MAAKADHRWGKVIWVLPVIIAALAFIIRFTDLDFSLRSDEIEIVKRSSGTSTYLDFGNGAIYYPVVRLFTKILGVSELAVRLPSVLLGVAAVVLMLFTGRIWFDRATGLVAALLLSVSAMHVELSREAHSYGMFAFVSLLCLHMLWWVLDDGRPGFSVALGVVVGLTMLTHLFGVFLLISMLLVVAADSIRRSITIARTTRKSLSSAIRPAARNLATIAVVSLLVAAPVVVQVVEPLVGLWQKASGAPITAAAETIGRQPRFDITFSFCKTLVLELATWRCYSSPVAALFWSFYFMGIIFAYRAKRMNALIMLAITCIPVPLTVVFSYVSGLGWNTRRLIFLVPVVLLVIAVGITSFARLLNRLAERLLQRPVPAWSGGLFLLLALTWPMAVVPLTRAAATKERHWQHWKEVACFLEGAVKPGETVVIWPDRSVRFYYPHHEQLVLAGEWLRTGADGWRPSEMRIWFVILDFLSTFDPDTAHRLDSWIRSNGLTTFKFDQYITISFSQPAQMLPEQQLLAAESLIHDALDCMPTSWHIHQAVGDFHALRGDYEAALRAYVTPRRRDPDTALYQHLAETIAARRPAEALQLYDKALAINATLGPAHLGRGRVLLRLGDGRNAEESLRKALLFGPDHYEAASVLASMLCDQGRADEAITVLQQAREHETGLMDFKLRLQIAGVLTHGDRHQEALTRVIEALALYDDTKLDDALAQVYSSPAETAAALITFARLLEARPESTDLAELLGRLANRQVMSLLDAGSIVEAVATCRAHPWLSSQRAEEQVAIADRFVLGARQLAGAGAHGQATEARAAAADIYRQVLRTSSARFPAVYCSLGRLLSDLGEHGEAIRYLQQASQLLPDDTEVWANLCLAASRAGQADDAIAACQEALALQPEHPYVNGMLAKLYERKSRWREAIPLAEAAARASPNKVARRFNLTLLARAHAALGEAANACTAYQQANEIQTSAEVTAALEELGCAHH